MYHVRNPQLPPLATEQLVALERRWRLSDQQQTFRNPEFALETYHPSRPRLAVPYRRQRPPC